MLHTLPPSAFDGTLYHVATLLPVFWSSATTPPRMLTGDFALSHSDAIPT